MMNRLHSDIDTTTDRLSSQAVRPPRSEITPVKPALFAVAAGAALMARFSTTSRSRRLH